MTVNSVAIITTNFLLGMCDCTVDNDVVNDVDNDVVNDVCMADFSLLQGFCS